MTVALPKRLTADEFIAWAMARDGCFVTAVRRDGELGLDPPGIVLAVAPLFGAA